MADRGSGERPPLETRDEMPEISEGDSKWLKLIRTGYRTSTDFMDDGIRNEWESALDRFSSRHPGGSKYYQKNYRGRSKIFRPKTRSLSRRSEAKAAIALFSNTDLVDVRGQNSGDETQAAAARYRKALLQYRLEHSIPWFVTAIGARQDCFNNGVCISLQSWAYEVEEEYRIEPEFGPDGVTPLKDEEGYELGREVLVNQRVVRDEPYIDLHPPENVRFDPNADWRDPLGTSPYVAVMIPMYAGDVLEKMEKPNPVTGEPEWRRMTLSQILTGGSADNNFNETVRQARVGRNRQDPMDTSRSDESSTVWVHLNIVRDGFKDYGFYSLGTMRLLSDPVPIEELLPLGRDALTFGFSIIEAHRPYPSGGNTLAAPLQNETNDVANQRMDNVKLALNQRYFIRRGTNVDQAALVRSTPGGGVMVDDPERDVKVMTFRDVTGSSYQEQDRLTQELDELTGNFSSSSVQANRSLNETVGGMSMLMGDASEVAEVELRTWVETWVEKVMRKFDRLIAMFETDEVIQQVAAGNAGLAMLYGNSALMDRFLDEEMVVSVNVGMGNTNPAQRMQRFSNVLAAVGQIPSVAERLNPDEIAKEMFAMGGYSDSTRFILPEQPPQEGQQDSSVAVAQIKSEDSRYNADRQLEGIMAKIAADRGIKLTELYERLGLEYDKLQSDRDIKALEAASRNREMNLRRDTGAGI